MKTKTRNCDIRNRAKAAKVSHWEIAEQLQIHEAVFSRMLRHELPAEEKQKIFEIIDRIAEGGAE